MTGLEIFDTIDADGDGVLTQAEIDKLLNDRHAAHDANADGNLDLKEFAGLWNETMHPLTVRAFQMLDTDDDGIVTRAEYDRPFAGIVEWFDRDGSLSNREGWDDDDAMTVAAGGTTTKPVLRMAEHQLASTSRPGWRRSLRS
ncbi:MAG: EF-hand domain-containing protein [Paracoccaceae bacterium]|nr:EF-hand domain-containing protein [Paracoccaceae bacterium]